MVIAASSPMGRCTWRATHALASAKKPDRRRLATTIMIPSNRVMVPKSTAR